MSKPKIKINTPEEAREYLLKVIKDWNEFNRTHAGIKQALSILLGESEVENNDAS